MHEDYTLLTPENVELRYEVAGPGSRLVAAMVDYTILGFGYLAITFGAAFAGEAISDLAGRLEDASPQLGLFFSYGVVALGVLLAFLGWWGYFALFELLWNGQSPGKRLLRLRVVRTDGRPIGITASLVRNVLRAIDLFPLLPIGILVMLLNRSNRRLGDLAAGSLVVREPRPLPRGVLTSAAIPEVPAARVGALPNAGRLSMAHCTLARDYFARRGKLPPGRADALAAHLAADLARVLEVPPSDIGDPATFLATAIHAFEAQHRYYDAPV
ncbi:MAG: RDD family protein [Chloroflexi bacterium]|nr:RDD family protein [Chloroflexota bacterium]